MKVIFIQPEFDERNAETISKQTGAKIISINPLNYDWDTEMLHVTKALITQ
ncbi:zinc ABC transporter [Bacteroides reticulotermitis JCM 10512]|uniref:Zinc ABC transporter n=1 Tax=Bacteroides reticulotermitis JCM 10512 TaxID=1445607 RepID=W4UY62_9BACE|nr:zinc ABC transporter [Bacteroides reticulotermitis JCM 10512]